MNTRRLMAWLTPVAAAAAVLPLTAQTQTANEIYRQERADCLAGRTAQSQADCLHEARSALRDRRAGALEPGATSAAMPTSGDVDGSADALPPRADRG